MFPTAERRIAPSSRRTSRCGRPPGRRGPLARFTRMLAGSAVMAVAAGAAGPLQAQGTSPTLERGRALYETRCIACHDRSVHRRESRRASDFPALRAQVSRWSETAGGEWKSEEIDAVTAYLNDRYYRYPCPPAICRDPTRASLR
jgi:mono/diheme cytochrome c family protein